jgi:hypothetical protein
VTAISEASRHAGENEQYVQKSKKNHWVPQAYLRGFAANSERTKIWRFGRTEGDPELKPIEKVAVQFYLYAPRDERGIRDYAFEKQLSELEQWFGSCRWQLLLTEYMDLGDEALRRMISLLAAVMFLRNPRTLDASNDIHRQIVNWFEQHPVLPDSYELNGKLVRVDPSDWDRFREGNEEDLKRVWISTVKDAAWLAELFMTMRWSVVLSDTPAFITTDHPLTVTHPSPPFRGFKNPETFVIFPLNPHRLLIMDNRMNEPQNQYYLAGNALPSWNFTLWRNAIEYMFCHRNPDEVLSEIVTEAEKQGFA